MSPVNPASPVSQTATVVSTPSVTPGVPAASVSMDVTGSATATETAPVSTTSASPTASTKTETKTETTSTPASTPKASQPPFLVKKDSLSIGGLNRALSLELFVKPGIQQPNVFPEVSINQSIPPAIRHHNDFLMELLNLPLKNQADKLKRMADDTVEYEQ